MALANDRFKLFDDNLDSPSKYAVSITPTDESELAVPTRALYIGVSGNVNIRLVGNTSDPSNTSSFGANTLFVNVVQGTILPLRVVVIQSTLTTASEIVGLY